MERTSKITTIRLASEELELYNAVADCLGITFGELCRKSLREYLVAHKSEIVEAAKKALDALSAKDVKEVIAKLRAKKILREATKNRLYSRLVAKGVAGSLAERISSINEEEIERLVELLRFLSRGE